MFIPKKTQVEEIVKQYGTPVFVTDAETIRARARQLLTAFSAYDMKIFYALKSNYNPHVLNVIKGAGIYGVDAVSPFEVRLALEVGYTPEQVVFTPSNPSNAEMQEVGKAGVLHNLGALSELERFGKLFPGEKVSIRISPEVGAGEFAKIATGQLETKFGITCEQIPDVQKIVKKYKLQLVGIHSHIGSGFYQTSQFKTSVEAVCAIARQFPSVTSVDFGGGFGVQYRPGKPEINLAAFAAAIKGVVAKFEKETGRHLELRIEPGKFLVTQSTVLLATVTTIKQKKKNTFVGVDVGMQTLIRPAMYGAYHHVVNMSNPKGKKQRVQVAGNACETCDIFNEKIDLAQPREGDILAILCAGGHGAAMSSNYNLRPLVAEVMIENKKIALIRKQQTYEQVLETFTHI